MEDDDMPRPHHYAFAHRALPAMGAEPSYIAALLEPQHAQRILDALLNDVGRSCREHEEPEVPRDGLRGLPTTIGGHRAIIVQLPPVQRPAEAHFVALVEVRQPNALLFFARKPVIRCFTLEHGHDLDGSTRTVLCEWAGGRHGNLGTGPEASVAGFGRAIARLISA